MLWNHHPVWSCTSNFGSSAKTLPLILYDLDEWGAAQWLWSYATSTTWSKLPPCQHRLTTSSCLYISWFSCHFSFRYGRFRLIDIPGLRDIMPVTMETFIDHVKASSKKGAEILSTQWVAECCAIIDDRRDMIEGIMPSDDQVMHCIHVSSIPALCTVWNFICSRQGKINVDYWLFNEEINFKEICDESPHCILIQNVYSSRWILQNLM